MLGCFFFKGNKIDRTFREDRSQSRLQETGKEQLTEDFSAPKASQSSRRIGNWKAACYQNMSTLTSNTLNFLIQEIHNIFLQKKTCTKHGQPQHFANPFTTPLKKHMSALPSNVSSKKPNKTQNTRPAHSEGLNFLLFHHSAIIAVTCNLQNSI